MSDINEKKRALAQAFSEQIGKIDQEASKTFINEVVEAVAVEVKKIPEPVFKEIFLPYFTGEKTPTRDSDAMAHWVGLVGSATDPADVVNMKGETIFRVPPLIDTSLIKTTDRRGSNNFATIFTVYEDQSKVHPSLGNRWLAEELANKAVESDSGEETSYSWKPVLEYYGIASKDPAKPSVENTGNDDDLVFED